MRVWLCNVSHFLSYLLVHKRSSDSLLSLFQRNQSIMENLWFWRLSASLVRFGNDNLSFGPSLRDDLSEQYKLFSFLGLRPPDRRQSGPFRGKSRDGSYLSTCGGKRCTRSGSTTITIRSSPGWISSAFLSRLRYFRIRALAKRASRSSSIRTTLPPISSER